MLLCKMCLILKETEEFTVDKRSKRGYRYECNLCRNKRRKILYNEFKETPRYNIHLEIGRARNQTYYRKNKQKIGEEHKLYQNENKDKILLYLRKWRKERLLTDPAFKMRCMVSQRVWRSLKKQFKVKGCSVWSKLPYTPQQLKEHLEKQFEEWMNWDNYRFLHFF